MTSSRRTLALVAGACYETGSMLVRGDPDDFSSLPVPDAPNTAARFANVSFTLVRVRRFRRWSPGNLLVGLLCR